MLVSAAGTSHAKCRTEAGGELPGCRRGDDDMPEVFLYHPGNGRAQLCKDSHGTGQQPRLHSEVRKCTPEWQIKQNLTPA